MHHGAPAHFRVTAGQYLNESYSNYWINRDGPRFWPSRAPDLDPKHFYTGVI